MTTTDELDLQRRMQHLRNYREHLKLKHRAEPPEIDPTEDPSAIAYRLDMWAANPSKHVRLITASGQSVEDDDLTEDERQFKVLLASAVPGGDWSAVNTAAPKVFAQWKNDYQQRTAKPAPKPKAVQQPAPKPEPPPPPKEPNFDDLRMRVHGDSDMDRLVRRVYGTWDNFLEERRKRRAKLDQMKKKGKKATNPGYQLTFTVDPFARQRRFPGMR